MATSLFAITNSSLNGKEGLQDYQTIKQSLKTLSKKSKYFQEEQVNEEINWDFEISENKVDEPFHIYFESPFHFSPQLYPECGLIFFQYKYRLLYEIKIGFWFESFRKELWEMITIMGGTEIIFLADNCCDKLSSFLEMVFEGRSYQSIKDQMTQELGKPLTDYNKLEYEKLDYKNITEFFLDDFKDLNK